MTRATAIEELEPLLALCRSGRLFEVQEWVKQGKPVALPHDARAKGVKRNPLRVAMETGFHSLVQVLLEAGAPVQEGNYIALDHAISLRRPDLAALLLQHGAKVQDVSMRHVLDMWHQEMVDLFLANGASLTDDYPVAFALINKMRPALGLVKRFAGADPHLMRQAEIALRFHAREGSAKWVSLLVWVGANPWARGPDRIEDAGDEGTEEDGHLTAIQWAVFRGSVEALGLRKFITKPDAKRPEMTKLIEDACHAPDSSMISMLLDLGHLPDALPDRGTAAISSLIHSMSWDFPSTSTPLWSAPQPSGGIDSSRARERMKMLHLLVAHGAKWLPGDKREIGGARRHLLKMARDYLLEFAWLMQRYHAARRKDMEDLFRPASMARLLSTERETASRIIASIPDGPSDAEVEQAEQRPEARTPPDR